ncbi:amino acid permease [Daphnia sinensis]|uniref:Amino acid permease n=1 Tax=Daphnia sinensis TaxID=1820382 RepID=A0AAD5KE52_9CRUS|nr:amino acid permease [Daphnia sinensis]
MRDRKAGFSDAETESDGLKRVLNVKDLTLMGIAAVIGAGIFSTIGKCSIPRWSRTLCYAEFASRIPVAGSAYTYAYASFGELIAWIIGWDLLMEYAIGNIAVAISWSEYFTNLLKGFNIHIPAYLTMDYLSASKAHAEFVAAGSNLSGMSEKARFAVQAWTDAPGSGNFRFIADIPALAIVFFITYLVYIGIKETKKATNAMVILKVGVVLAVIILGFFYVKPANWDPFMPNGFAGMMKGVSGVFFAYIGFDAISTTAEECKNPQRDLPKGIDILSNNLYSSLHSGCLSPNRNGQL